MQERYHVRRGTQWVQVTHQEYAAARASVSMGLGDLVASVAQPIARAIDRVAGTNLANCGGCKQRRAALNRLVPRV